MRETFLATVDSARALLDHPALPQRWNDPSALERMTIGALTAHLSRAVKLVPRYLDTPAEPPYRDAPGYFLSFAGQIDTDLDSEIAVAVRSRAEEESAAGLSAVLIGWDTARRELDTRLTPETEERGISVLGSSMRVADYLVTRTVELVIHSDDLAASLGVDPPDFEGEAFSAVISCLIEMAARRSSPLALIRAMTRVERSDPGVLRVL
jgi:hypothetical protein